jgi:hypothetical protein
MNGYKRAIKRLAALLAVLLLLPGGLPAMAETFSAIVTANSMAVYGEASMSNQIATLPKNTVVEINGYSTTIAKITYNGQSGYAGISDMKRVDEAKKAVLSAAAPVYREALETSRSVTVPAGTKVYLLARSGECAMVEKNGYLGYVKGDAVVEAGDNWEVSAAANATATNATCLLSVLIMFSLSFCRRYRVSAHSRRALPKIEVATTFHVPFGSDSANGISYVARPPFISTFFA